MTDNLDEPQANLPLETEVVDLDKAQEDSVSPELTPAKKSFWREILETVILTILVFFLFKALIQNYRIEGSSMEPNFHTRQLIMVNKAAYFHFDVNAWLRMVPGVKAEGSNLVWPFGTPGRGDVIVLSPPDVPLDDYIKRVIGLPGEKIEIRDSVVYINEKPLQENYIKDKTLSPYGPVIVPPGNVFVMGDNRNASRDSRIFGFLAYDKIVGKVWLAYWPFGPDWGFVPEIVYK